jgi:hypothetical protein
VGGQWLAVWVLFAAAFSQVSYPRQLEQRKRWIHTDLLLNLLHEDMSYPQTLHAAIHRLLPYHVHTLIYGTDLTSDACTPCIPSICAGLSPWVAYTHVTGGWSRSTLS